jgi:glycosyltransferase involved in cell wall biosynthesis
MKIAIVHSFYRSDNPSGENNVVCAQIDALKEAGHNVVVLAKHTDDLLDEPGYKYKAALTAATGHGDDPTAMLRSFNPDIVHVHNLFPNWGTRWLRRWPGPIIATLHNYRTVCANGLLWRDGHDCHLCPSTGSKASLTHACYQNSRSATLPLAISTRGRGKHSDILNHADALITLNRSAFAFYSGLLPAKKVHEIPNFAAASPRKATSRTGRWAYVGRMTEEKGIPWLLKHWPDDQELDLVGSGPIVTDIQDEALHRPNIHFHGPKPHNEAIDLIAGAKGLIIPSLWSEGIPTVALEALSLGTPLVLSSHISAAESLTSGGAGIILNMNEHMFDLSHHLASMERNLVSMSSAARSLHQSRYSTDAWLALIGTVYSETLISQETLS